MKIAYAKSLAAAMPSKHIGLSVVTLLTLLSSVSGQAACPAPTDTVIRIQYSSTCSWAPASSTINSTLGWTYQVWVGGSHVSMGGMGHNKLDVTGDLTYNITPSGVGVQNWGIYVNAPDDSIPTNDYTAGTYMKVGNLTLNMNTPASGNPVANVTSTGIWVDTNGWFEGGNVNIKVAHLNTQLVASFESYGVLVGGAVNGGDYNPNFVAHAQFENLTIDMKALTSGLGSIFGTTMAAIRAIAQSKVGSSGYDSGSGVVAVTGMTTITTSGNYSLGVYVSGRNSLVDLNDSSITTSGTNSSAIKLGKYRTAGTGSGQFISRGRMEIDTTAATASSILLIGDVTATSGYSPTTLHANFDTSSTVIKSGREAVNYSTADLSVYGSADGIIASFNNAVMTTTSATASLIKVEGSASYRQTNAEFNLRGTGSSLTAADDGWLFEVQNYASFTANVREGSLQGMVTTGDTGVSSGTFTLNMSNNAIWHLAAKGGTTTSTLTELNLASGATVDASAGDFTIAGNVSSINGVLDLSGPGKSASVPGYAGQTLTIKGDYAAGTFAAGTNGTLIIDTVLGDSSSPTDKLVIDGGVATGDSSILVRNAGGFGALTTGDGILVVEAVNNATTANATFSLGNRVAAGAYEYTLHRGASATDNWYLSSLLIPVPPPEPEPGPGPAPQPGPVLPNYRVEVPVYMVAPALANRLGLAMLGTYHDRNGEDYILPAAPAYEERIVTGRNGKPVMAKDPARDEELRRYAGWARVFGETGSVGYGGKGSVYTRLDKFWKNGPSYDYDLAGLQAGFDLYRRENAKGTSDIVGLYAAAGRIDSDVRAVYGGKAGSLSMDGYAFGAYWTRKGASGWYVDAVAQAMLFDDISGSSVKGIGMKSSNGWGFTGSLEGGYPFALGYGLALEPQAQLIYQHISLDNTRDIYARITYGDTDALYGRIGFRLTKTWALTDNRPMTLWLRGNLWHTFGDDAKTTFSSIYGVGGTTLKTALGGTWGQVGVGVSGRIAESINLFASGDYNIALGEGRGHGLSGRLGLRVVW